MARPGCKGFCRDRRLISLLQRIRPRRSPPGQDGDARAQVLINSSASCAVFNTRLPERRLTVRPSRLHGHDVRLMSPEYVRPYVKAQKNDDRDAEGIAEAATRPTMRFVELKSPDQLDMQTL